jgi:actin-related protein 6
VICRFKSVFRTNPADLACYKNRVEHPSEPCCLVVDCGFSNTHVVPFVNGKRVRDAVRRIDVGGKLMTNHLKEIVSYRQLHVLDETYVMNACREDCCYVSLDFDADMRRAELRSIKENDVGRDYVLPDFTSLRRGEMKSMEQSVGRPTDEGEQIIRMNNERFAVPELLFNPSDIGIEQAGIAETIVNVVNECPEESRRWLYRNIVLVGGCAATKNFGERVERDVRVLASDIYKVTELGQFINLHCFIVLA